MNESRPVVTENRQLECREGIKHHNVFFRKIRAIKILMQGPNPTIFHCNGLPLVESFPIIPWWKESCKQLRRKEVIENRANGSFFHNRSIRILTQCRKPRDFNGVPLYKERDFDRAWMREVRKMVFFEKSKLQLLGNSVLLAPLDVFSM